MTAYELLLFAHLAGLMLLVGGVGTSLACKVRAGREGSAAAVLALLETARVAVSRVAMPGSLVLIGAGVGLVAQSNGAWSITEPWIAGAMLLWVLSALVGVRLHAPRSREARALARELAAEGLPVTGRLRAVVRGGRAASGLDVALLVGMVALMVFKPGA
jgi:hypothetical protein